MRVALAFLLSLPAIVPAADPVEVKVMVVTMFERGADTGDEPGEFQNWVEREKLATVHAMPHGYRDLRTDGRGLYAMVTGVGTAKAAGSVMAVGLDPRLDLRKTYWLVAGIAGVDAADASLGSAAWAEWVADGDLAHEIDAREIPKDWKTGMIPLRRTRPYETPLRPNTEGEIYRVNPALQEWAYQLTKGVKLQDTPEMQTRRALYKGYPNAQRPPFVLKGDTMSSMTFWHGKLLNEWANDWMRYYSGGKANYVTTAMEDTGTLQSLTFLAKAGKVDLNRVMILRTASNYDMQTPGQTATESLAATKVGHYSAYLPSLDAAHRVGSVVVHELVRDWNRYRGQLPVYTGK
ncbi:MAG: purine nucleoside permease [Acidobacteria bacterium]|nr:purine nucleoside permease [Acidobacteriota bacterium]